MKKVVNNTDPLYSRAADRAAVQNTAQLSFRAAGRIGEPPAGKRRRDAAGERRPEAAVERRPDATGEHSREAAAGRRTGAASARGRRAAGKAIIIVAVIIATALCMSATPLFSIAEIEINGNRFYDKSLILARSGLRVGQNGFAALRGGNVLKMLALRCSAAELAVAAACPYVKTVQARYIIPGAIVIDIEERNKCVVIPYFDSGLIIDEEGVVVDILKDYRSAELPVAQGIAVTRYEIGSALAPDDKARVETVLSLLNAFRQADRDGEETAAWKILTIDVGDLRNIVFSLSNGIDVNLGDGADLYYRVSVTKEIVARGVEAGETGTISFSNGGARPVFAAG